jgi:hypothetical protein
VHGQRRDVTGHVAGTALTTSLIVATVILLVGCQTANVGGGPRSGGSPHLQVAGAQLSPQLAAGDEARAVLWITNNGDWPVLLLGITPQSPADEPVSFVKRLAGTAPSYNAQTETLSLRRSSFLDHVTLHRGLLLPGEALQIYTSLLPMDKGMNTHTFRLDYLTAPRSTFERHLYMAGGEGTLESRQYTRYDSTRAPLKRPRLRRTLLADGHRVLTHAAARFQILIGPVEERYLPLVEAYDLTGISPGGRCRYSHFLDGWAFARPGGVTVATREHVLTLDGVTLEALRAVDLHPERFPLPIVFDDAGVRPVLERFLLASDASADMALIPRERLLELMLKIPSAGLTLTAVAIEPGSLSGETPLARPLRAHQ